MKDLLALAGLALLAAGLWWIYPPAALVVVGLVLLAVGVVAHLWRRP